MPATYFVIQVKTRGEQKYLSLTESITEGSDLQILWPRRSLRIRRKGQWRNVLSPIFPGYIFLQTESMDPHLYWELKRVPGFYRFLKSNHDIQPLPEADARILTRLLRFGEIVHKSVATFDPGGRIRILEGPLKGLEGHIVRVDRRKGRAKIRLDLYEKSYVVDFGFQDLEKMADRLEGDPR